MRYLITLLLTFSLITTASASVEQVCPSYQRLNSGDSAPCNGHFFNDEAEEQVRKDVRDGDLRKQQLELKDLQVDNLKEDRDRWKEEAQYQAEVRHSTQNDLMYGFLGGIGLTLLVIFATGQVSK